MTISDISKKQIRSATRNVISTRNQVFRFECREYVWMFLLGMMSKSISGADASNVSLLEVAELREAYEAELKAVFDEEWSKIES